MAGLTRPESQAELAVLCKIEHQLPQQPILGESGNQVTAAIPRRILFHSSDEMTSNLDLPLAFSEVLKMRLE